MLLASPIVSTFAWITAPLANVHPSITFVDVTNEGHYYYSTVDLLAVPPGFGHAVITSVLEIQGHDYAPPVFDDLYAAAATSSILVPTSLRDSVGANAGADVILQRTWRACVAPSLRRQ